MVQVLLGNDYQLWIDSATPGTFARIAGQGTFSESRSAAKIDTSEKGTAGFNTAAYGNISWSGSLDIRVKLPDTTGYTRMETVANATPAAPVNIQLRKGGIGGLAADSVFSASVFITITGRTFNKDGTVDCKAEMSLAAAPTLDVLA